MAEGFKKSNQTPVSTTVNIGNNYNNKNYIIYNLIKKF
jgi:hypothetical protein